MIARSLSRRSAGRHQQVAAYGLLAQHSDGYEKDSLQ